MGLHLQPIPIPSTFALVGKLLRTASCKEPTLSVHSARTEAWEHGCVARQHDVSVRFLVGTSVALHDPLVWEKDSSVDPISLAKAHKGSYYLTSVKLKGRRNCLRIMMKERRKMKVMKRSRKSER